MPAVQSSVGIAQVGRAVVRLTQTKLAWAELLHGSLVLRSCKSRGQKETVICSTSKYAEFCNYFWCDAMRNMVGYAQNGRCCLLVRAFF